MRRPCPRNPRDGKFAFTRRLSGTAVQSPQHSNDLMRSASRVMINRTGMRFPNRVPVFFYSRVWRRAQLR
jgi:hypothetical protein